MPICQPQNILWKPLRFSKLLANQRQGSDGAMGNLPACRSAREPEYYKFSGSGTAPACGLPRAWGPGLAGSMALVQADMPELPCSLPWSWEPETHRSSSSNQGLTPSSTAGSLEDLRTPINAGALRPSNLPVAEPERPGMRSQDVQLWGCPTMRAAPGWEGPHGRAAPEAQTPTTLTAAKWNWHSCWFHSTTVRVLGSRFHLENTIYRSFWFMKYFGDF